MSRVYEITTDPHELERVKEALEVAEIEIASSEMAKIPKSVIPVAGKEAKQLLKLMNAIEDQDDVQQVWANFDISDEELEAADEE